MAAASVQEVIADVAFKLESLKVSHLAPELPTDPAGKQASKRLNRFFEGSRRSFTASNRPSDIAGRIERHAGWQGSQPASGHQADGSRAGGNGRRGLRRSRSAGDMRFF